jgi:CBS domain-containing protein
MVKNDVVDKISSTRLVTIPITATVQAARDLMREKNFRHLPATNDLGEIVGIISDRDVQRAVTVTRADNKIEYTEDLSPNHLVKDFMSWPVHKVAGDVTIRDVALRMLNEKISALVVTYPEGKVRGIVTTDDLIRYLIQLLEKDPSRLRLAVDAVFDDFVSAANWN